MPEWDADRLLSPTQARDLIESRFPELAPATLVPFGEGFDNQAFLVRDTWVFRFPRRQIAVPWLANEARLLPRLGPRLPQPIPQPVFVAEPDDAWDRPFIGYRHLAGTTACRVDWTDTGRASLAPALGAFLSALHRCPVEATWDPPPDDIHRADLRRRAPRLIAATHALAEQAPHVPVDAVIARIEAVADTPEWVHASSWTHGDLYARHLLIDEDNRLCGVIDWGDLHVGDPAVDLGIAWSFLPADARPTFLAAYGSVDPNTWARASYRAVHYGILLWRYGLGVRDPHLVRAARESLRLGLA